MTTKPALKNKKPIIVKPINQRIEQAAWAGLEQKITNIPTDWNFCMKFARRVVETALGLPDRGFYRLIHGVDANPSAKELEALIRAQKPSWVVSSPQAGDLVFWNYLPLEWGHVGVLVTYRNALWVAQNTTITKLGIDYGGALQLVKLSEMQKPTTYIRIAG